MSESSHRSGYYKRVQRVVGTHMNNTGIHMYNTPFMSKALELLISCGVLNVAFKSSETTPALIGHLWGFEGSFEPQLVKSLMRHNQFEDRWNFVYHESTTAPALVIGGGTYGDALHTYQEGVRAKSPSIIAALLNNGMSLVTVVPFGHEFPWTTLESVLTDRAVREITPDRYFDWVDLNNQVANLARGILLRGTDWDRPEINTLIDSGNTTLILQHPSWPYLNRYLNLAQQSDVEWLSGVIARTEYTKSSVDLSGKTALIVGIGSLGSMAANHFRALGSNVVGVDGKDVSLYNPIRQLYPTDAIGHPKTTSLSAELAHLSTGEFHSSHIDHNGINFSHLESELFFAGHNIEIEDSRAGGQVFTDLLDIHSPDVIILTTAHSSEFRMARIARERNIPHISASCYARARWFESIVVNGEQGPCLGCLKGHVHTGSAPSLTEEQIARYSPAEAGEDLNAEPATGIDTGRAVDTFSRIGAYLMASQHPNWLTTMLSEERTYLIGGNTCEHNDDEWSFGIEHPGQLQLYGVVNLIGGHDEANKTCIYCRREHEVFIHRRAPEF